MAVMQFNKDHLMSKFVWSRIRIFEKHTGTRVGNYIEKRTCKAMRKVLLRWKVSSLSGIDEIDTLMEICERIEVLGHLSTESDGVTQLVELKIKEGRELSEISELNSFEVLEKHEEDESGILVSIHCSHPLAISAVELSNIYVYPPYGIDSKNGLEFRIFGISSSIRSFLEFVRTVMPPDNISVQTIKNGAEKSLDFLTEKQREVLELAVRRGYYEDGSEVTLKQLADQLGIARSTIGEHLKRAESEVVKKAVSDFN
ncbi:MAG: helix-turn-helix domain-containing protein [Candidatus Neomarinimicrobiota bacterium]